MFEQERINELRSMYRLFVRREPSLNEIISFMKPWMDKEGKKIILNSEYQKDPCKFTQELLDFKKKCDGMVS